MAHLKRNIVCTTAAASMALSMGFASAEPLSSREHAPIAPQAACTAPAQLARLDHSLKRVSQKIQGRQALTIVAVGSSSTYGEGASSPDHSYPSRLAAELKVSFSNSPVTVLNRGVGGDTTADMLERFDRDVFAAKPDLVIWQVGSNSVLGGLPVGPAAALIREGLGRLQAAGSDVIIVDPQYAPAIINNDGGPMVDMIATTARQARVNLFGRFAVMRHWRLTQKLPFNTFVTDDELHMNDWGYGCMAKLLAGAINDATTRPTVSAKSNQYGS